MFDNAYKNKRVLVTGHTGFKGSWLSFWLLQLGAEVAGFSLYIPSEPSNFEVLNLSEKIQHHVGDIRDLNALSQVFQKFQPDVVMHLAAQAVVRRSYDQPKLTFDTNVGGTVNVLEAIRQTPSVKAGVLITSDKCYENVEWEYGYRETDRLGGKDPYSAAKACAEIACSAYFRSFFSGKNAPQLATVRAGNVIGGGDWAADRIVPDCIRAWSKESTAVIRNPEATRPWQHVLEPLSGYLFLGSKLLQQERGLTGEAFNFGPSADVTQSVADLIEEMKKNWPQSKWAIDSGAIANKKEASLLKLSCDKVLKRLGWKATLAYPEMVKMTTEWYLKFYREKQGMLEYSAQQIIFYQRLAKERKQSWAI